MSVVAAGDGATDDGVAHVGEHTFRVVTVPLLLDDDTQIGSLYLATSLDRRLAQRARAALSRTRIAIVSGGRLLASTLRPAAAQRFEAATGDDHGREASSTLDGESFAFRATVPDRRHELLRAQLD